MLEEIAKESSEEIEASRSPSSAAILFKFWRESSNL